MATEYRVRMAKASAPQKLITNDESMIVFSEYVSINMPAGIEVRP